MAILVTGGAGYIGSHTVLCLLQNSHDVIVLDNFINSSSEALSRVENITGRKIKFYEGNICNRELLSQIFSAHTITHVIHFAGLKSVGESVKKPIDYYNNNVVGSLVLLEEMLKHNIFNIIFSSSATVYGPPDSIPLKEDSRVGGTTNPYGTSKLIAEKILKDASFSIPELRVTTLRYFNPVGSHSSGMIGEAPTGIPNNIMPYICQVAIGRREFLSVFGSDYPTKDGTGVRDYIHVMDLAEGHVSALEHCNKGPNHKVYNLGTGKGYSVLELLKTFEKVTNNSVPYVLTERRQGDIAECWSDPSKAFRELGWKASRSIDEMISDAWNWQNKNPDGYNVK